MIVDLKEKTKVYVQKIQLDHEQQISRERDALKQAQDKVEAAKIFFAKMRDEETKLRADLSSCSKRESDLVDVIKMNDEHLKLLKELTSVIMGLYTKSEPVPVAANQPSMVELIKTDLQEIYTEFKDINDKLAVIKESERVLKDLNLKQTIEIQSLTQFIADLQLVKQNDTSTVTNPSTIDADRPNSSIVDQPVIDLNEPDVASTSNLIDNNVKAVQLSEEMERLRRDLNTALASKNELSRKLEVSEQDRKSVLDQLRSRTLEAEETSTATSKALADLKAQLAFVHSSLSTKSSEVIATQAECSLLSTRLTAAESQRQESQRQRDELTALLKAQEAALSEADQREKALRCQLSQVSMAATQKTAQLNTDLAEARTHLLNKEQTLAELTANMAATGSANSALQARNELLKSEVEKLGSQLHAALVENQERKKKVRAYVDTLSADKKVLEDAVREKEMRLAEVTAEGTALSQSLAVTEKKLKLLREQTELDKECHASELRNLEAKLTVQIEAGQEEINRLKAIVTDYSQSAEDQVKQSRDKVAAALLETEQHKQKRLAARNEMISLSETLERTQLEVSNLQTFLQQTLTPLVYEQVSSLQLILTSVDTTTELMNARRAKLIQNRAREFLIKRFNRRRGGGSDGQVDTALDISLRGDAADEVELVELFEDSGTAEAGDGDITSGSTGRGGGKRGNSYEDTSTSTTGSMKIGSSSEASKLKSLSEAMKTAESLKFELDRVQAGLVLLGQSVERLSDGIVLDNTCSAILCRLLSLPWYVLRSSHAAGYSSLSSVDQSDHGAEAGYRQMTK